MFRVHPVNEYEHMIARLKPARRTAGGVEAVFSSPFPSANFISEQFRSTRLPDDPCFVTLHSMLFAFDTRKTGMYSDAATRFPPSS
jgi:hypothetical protein